MCYEGDVQLILNKPELPDPERDDGDAPDKQEWHLTFIAASDSASDNATIGVNSNATAGFDNRYDYVEPPKLPVGNPVRIYFDRSDWDKVGTSQFSRDIRPPLTDGDVQEWTLTVETIPNRDITLTWDKIADPIPETYTYTLYDPENDGEIDLAATSEYRFHSTGTRKLIVRVGTPEESASHNPALATGFGLSSIYPNPFNPSTTISYSLDRSGWTRVDVVDISGRLWTRLVDASQAAGSHSITWNAANIPTGVYIVRLTDGSGRMEVKKVVLMK